LDDSNVGNKGNISQGRWTNLVSMFGKKAKVGLANETGGQREERGGKTSVNGGVRESIRSGLAMYKSGSLIC